MTRKAYCGNLLWQSSLTLLVLECEEKRKLVVGSRAKLARDKWNIAKMNETTHSGEDWEDWKKNNGKTETDPELW